MVTAYTKPAARLALLTLATLSLLGQAVRAQAPAQGVASRLQQAIDASGLAEQVGVSVVHLRSGRRMFGHRAERPMNPASNMKLVTAAAALLELGPQFRTRTGLYGRQVGNAIEGGLYLRGFGDPTLTDADLVALAQALVRRGIKRVDEVIVDASHFDSNMLPPAFEQQPNEVSPFRAAVAALSVNRNAYELRVMPGAEAGSAARVSLTGAGYFDLDSTVKTSADGAPNVIAVQRAQGAQMSLKLSGSVPLGITGISYFRRIASPPHYAGHVMVDALRALRVQVPVRVGTGATPGSSALLSQRQSAPLSHVLARLGKNSDNFVAEMLVKLLSAERRGGRGSSEHGVQVVLQAIAKVGVPTETIEMVNGSGLFDGNAIAPSHLTALLFGMYQRADLRADYLSQLAIGGVDGTLSRRLRQLPRRGVVRAKTGTLAAVIGLSGYVLGPRADQGYAFSVLANDVRGKQGPARALADRIATLLAEALYAGK